jgi:acyl-homoserine lactone synthase
MVDHVLSQGVSVLTGVVTARFREQILAMGWQAVPLGPPRVADGTPIAAFRIEIDDDTPAQLAATGIYQPGALAGSCRRAA